MKLTTNYQGNRNVTLLEVDRHVSVIFSYDTPLALLAPTIGWVVNEETARYSKTSARHRTACNLRDRPHLSAERFNALMGNALSLDFDIPSSLDVMLCVWETRASPRRGS